MISHLSIALCFFFLDVQRKMVAVPFLHDTKQAKLTQVPFENNETLNRWIFNSHF